MADTSPSAPPPAPPASARLGVWLLIALLAGLAVALQAYVLGSGAVVAPRTPVPWVALVVGFVAAELFVIHVTVRREALSFAFAEVPWVLGLFVFPLGQLIAARVLGGALVLVWHRRQSLVKLAFNVAQIWLGASAAAAVWCLALGDGPSHSMRGWLAAVGSAIVIEVVAALAIAAVVTLHTGRSAGLPLALGTGTAASAASACFALVTMDVLQADWRGLWAMGVLAAFLWFAQQAHVALLRRHDAMERLQAFTRSVGSSDLRLTSVVEVVLTGVRDLLEVETVVLDLAGPGSFTCDADGVRGCPSPDTLPAASSGARRRGGHVPSLTVLLHGEGGTVGALTVGGRLGAVGGLRSSDLHLLEAVAGHAAVGLHNGRLVDLLRAQAEANEHQALHDALTGLPNRLLFDRTAAEVLSRGLPAAVLLLDLDRFKEVNDTLGHAAGDEVLRGVGERLRGLLGSAACVARLGGDEFAVVLAATDLEGAQGCATRISEVLAVPLDVLGVTLAVDASIGIAVSGGDNGDAADLLRRADVAMYEAKALHTRVAVYATDRDHNSAERLSLVAALRTGIVEGELVLEYQPKASTSTGLVSSVEALVRWHSPERGVVPPDAFIGVAEQTGLIGPLTDWVLTTALAQCRQWLDDGLDLCVAVNISPRTLHDLTFVGRVLELLKAADVPAHRLILEITEGALMVDPEGAVDVLWQLRRTGVRLSVDDLGVGQSSLSYLKRLPVHEVKVDRSFVTRMAHDGDDQAIVEAVVHLAHRLGMVVVAEGVEDERTWNLLRDLGTDAAQGYWISRPVPATELAPWLVRWTTARAEAVIPRPRALPARDAAVG